MSPEENGRTILKEAMRDKAPAFLSGNELDITFQTQLIHLEDHQVVIENRVPPEHICQLLKSRNFSLQVNTFRFEGQVLKSDGKNMIFPIKDEAFVSETRRSTRFSFKVNEQVICEILNPYDGETLLSKRVMDLSATGLSLRTALESQLFRPGTHLPQLKVLIDGEPYRQNPARVVYNRKLIDLGGKLRLQVGIKFET